MKLIRKKFVLSIVCLMLSSCQNKVEDVYLDRPDFVGMQSLISSISYEKSVVADSFFKNFPEFENISFNIPKYIPDLEPIPYAHIAYIYKDEVVSRKATSLYLFSDNKVAIKDDEDYFLFSEEKINSREVIKYLYVNGTFLYEVMKNL